MRILVDYRPALRERTGVGEYIHELARAYASSHPDELTLFTSSWKDRPSQRLSSAIDARIIDRRMPVRLLNFLWHRMEWPPSESLAGLHDVVHAPHPLLIPARHAAQVVTIHDLFFLTNAAQTRREIRRDYPALAASHARRADAVITSTEHGKRLVIGLGVDADRIYVCPAGAPTWKTLGCVPNVRSEGYFLFIGTLEPRKNLGALLDAYQALLERVPSAPPLVVAGRATPAASQWLSRMAHPPLAGHVRYAGYVQHEEREALYAGARVLVLPSLDEGFGLPALEAMSAGVPVVASNRGSLPEVVGNAGILVDPEDAAELSAALERFGMNDEAATQAGAAGLARARGYTWSAAAVTLRQAYMDAVRRRRSGRDARRD
jgi:glycosyltransferase involved in cell wall biosynthesis